MLLTIATTHRPATDLGFLLHKHPAKIQSFDLSFGRVHVFYPHADADRCTACLLLDVDAVGTVRGKSPDQGFLLGQCVNYRPYLAAERLPLEARLDARAGRRDGPPGDVRAVVIGGKGRWTRSSRSWRSTGPVAQRAGHPRPCGRSGRGAQLTLPVH